MSRKLGKHISLQFLIASMGSTCYTQMCSIVPKIDFPDILSDEENEKMGNSFLDGHFFCWKLYACSFFQWLELPFSTNSQVKCNFTGWLQVPQLDFQTINHTSCRYSDPGGSLPSHTDSLKAGSGKLDHNSTGPARWSSSSRPLIEIRWPSV